ncbi:mucin-13b isoform X3 [Hemibagrus wyckioides]|uniref:mucin-13b isoform X2 n=1 Tax=Hemibagrus wyckioides TaxID=337641 RepID=UPI00266CE230|nr:mucin-13b isoform X2 [Hemibagrus wyckioides]XP_058261651.1 mucin-13b isoform X3 [Hemibagrus wyckioides]
MALMKQLFSLCLLLLLVGGNADYSDTEYEDRGDIVDIEYEVIDDAEVINLELEFVPTSIDNTTTDQGASSPAPGASSPAPGASSPAPGSSSPAPDLCASDTCPSDSTCQELVSDYTCVCRPGLFYDRAKNSCNLAKTFPTDITLNMKYEQDMSDKNSALFKETANKILTALKTVFTDPHYLGSTVLRLRSGSVIADVENFFSPSSVVNEDIVKKELNTAIKDSKDNDLLFGAEVTYNSVCSTGFCDDKSTSCEPTNGLATCTCRKGYIKIIATQQACVSCPSGEKEVNSEKCTACSFGYSGFNCEESYLLILVVVACVLGILLLGTLTGAIVLYTRSKKTTKSSEKPLTNGNLEFTKPAGIPRIPRVNPNSGWQPNNLEMTNSGSRSALVIKDRSENTAMWSYDYPEDTRSQTPSRTGYGPSVSNNVPRATRNPYYDAYDDNVRRY